MLRRKMAILSSVLVTIGLLSACTPEQVTTYKARYGPLTEQQSLDWLDMPDVPVKAQNGDIINLDGSVDESPEAYVNSLPYSYMESGPAMEAFSLVALDRGLSAQWVSDWSAFAADVMAGESGFCPNLRRGAILANHGLGCVVEEQGTHSDSGFGQLISVHHGMGRWLCVEERICGPEAVIATPFNSMTALVALLQRSGSAPWCYNAAARSYHNCRLAP